MFLPKDQKWAWKSVAGAFITFAVTLSIDLCFSIIFKDIKNFYEVNSTIASSIYGFITGFRMLLGPLVVVTIKIFGSDKVTILGGLMVGLGLFISSCAPNMIIFMIGFGILTGIGLSFVVTAMFVVLSENFSKKKALAFGVASSGASIAYIIFPHIFALIILEYEFRSALMIFSAFSLNTVTVGLLFRKPRHLHHLETKICLQTEIPVIEQKIFKTKRSDLVKSVLKDSCLNAKPWKNHNFIFFIIGVSWFLIGMVPWTIFIIDIFDSIEEATLNIAVLTFTIEGISQFFARILSGLIFDIKCFRKYRGIICAICCFFSALSCILLVVIKPSIQSFLLISLFRGFCVGVYVSQHIVILGDLSKPIFLSTSIGILSFMKGIGCLFGSILSGVIRDYFKSYFETFIFLAVNQILAGLMIFYATVRYATKKHQ